ncbi:MAG: hypothetical protein KGM49_03000 [Sphingomonadales bacterium]|nr:hypothetical protein [Sphingomonadales bacterium]
MRLLTMLCVLALFALPGRGEAAPILDRLVIVVPAAAGGGYDRTAQSVAKVLQSDGVVGNIEIRHSPGAGGLIALAQFEGQSDFAVPTIFISGVTTLGAEAENHAVVSLADLEPVCQLSQVALTIAVRSDSPIHSLGDLIEVVRTDPDQIEWVGGSPGSADEILLRSIAAKLRVPHDQLKFIAIPGGGDPVLDRLMKGPQYVAIRSYEEFAAYPGRGQLRLLAISPANRLTGVDVPTMREAGLDLDFTDWKGVFVSPKAPVAQRQAIARVFDLMRASPAWAQEIASHGWRMPDGSPSAFSAQIATDRQRARLLLSQDTGSSHWGSGVKDMLARPWRYALLGFFIAGLLTLAIAWQRHAARDKDRELQRALDALEEFRSLPAVGNRDEAGERAGITRQLEAWQLSSAEMEIGWMILKGLQFKEIAAARGTSERTVRQQAQAIYAKSGLPNRSEFSAHFLEDLRF